MRKVVFPSSKTKEAQILLLSGTRFDVLAQARPGEGDFVACVLGRLGWSWGHFYRAAFCTLSPGKADEVILAITWLNVQKAWHGNNLFGGFDRHIEDDIAAYVLESIAGAKQS